MYKHTTNQQIDTTMEDEIKKNLDWMKRELERQQKWDASFKGFSLFSSFQPNWGYEDDRKVVDTQIQVTKSAGK